jgi:ketosteroid isomerase-like protein
VPLDPRAILRTVSARRDQETDSRKRAILALLEHHMAVETITPDVAALSATIADDVEYRFLGSSPDGLHLVGRDAVERFSERFLATAGNDVEFAVDNVAVSSHCVAINGILRRHVDPAGLETMSQHFGLAPNADAGDDDAGLVESRMAVFYRFDDEGLVVGKDMYSSRS